MQVTTTHYLSETSFYFLKGKLNEFIGLDEDTETTICMFKDADDIVTVIPEYELADWDIQTQIVQAVEDEKFVVRYLIDSEQYGHVRESREFDSARMARIFRKALNNLKHDHDAVLKLFDSMSIVAPISKTIIFVEPAILRVQTIESNELIEG